MASYDLTGADVLTAVCNLLDWDSDNVTQKAKAVAAISAAGKAACTWTKRDWSWLKGKSSFPTVADTASYDLWTVADAAMLSMGGIEQLHRGDDARIVPLDWREYQQWYDLERPTAATGEPIYYGLNNTASAATVWLRPIPDAVYTVYVDYRKRHALITGASGDELLVPSDYQYDIYVQSAVWLLRQDTMDAPIDDCRAFTSAMRRMMESDPGKSDKDPSMDYPIGNAVANGTGLTFGAY